MKSWRTSLILLVCSLSLTSAEIIDQEDKSYNDNEATLINQDFRQLLRKESSLLHFNSAYKISESLPDRLLNGADETWDNSDTAKLTPAAPEIIGGTTASKGEYPFFSSVSGSSEWLCGAALVAPDILLSAGHCAEAFPKGAGAIVNAFIQGKVSKGKVSNGKEIEGSVPVTIVDQVVHPDFKSFIHNDVMVLKISPPVTTITPVTINLAANLPTENEGLTIIGFGKLGDDSDVAHVLQEAVVSEVPTSICQSYYGNAIVADAHICVGNAQPFRGSCSGDSGGPLLGDANGGTATFGVLSFGASTCSQGPSVYTRLSGYTSFLKETICSMSDHAPAYMSCASNGGSGSGGGGSGGNKGSNGGGSGGNNGGDGDGDNSGSSSCASLEKSYQSCLENDLSLESSSVCVICLNNAFPANPSSCSDMQPTICVAPKLCGCATCSNKLAAYIKCASGCDSITCAGTSSRSSKMSKKKHSQEPVCVRRRKRCTSDDECCSNKCRQRRCK